MNILQAPVNEAERNFNIHGNLRVGFVSCKIKKKKKESVK